MKASDWVIASEKETYKETEGYALESILGFMYDEANTHDIMPRTELNAWWEARHRMLRNGQLIYTANQFDVLIGAELTDSQATD